MLNWEPFVVCFDSHGDMIDPVVGKLFFKFLDEFKPKHRGHGGDFFDLRPYRKGATEDEKREGTIVDIDAGLQFLDKLNPTFITKGNHDIRLWETLVKSSGDRKILIQDSVDKFEKRFSKIPVLPYEKRNCVYELGKLSVLHGFGVGGINFARRHAQSFGSCLLGHIHTIDIVSVEAVHPRVARVCGALCQLDMDYNSRQIGTLRQANGWSYGFVNKKTGDYFVFQAEVINGKTLVPKEFKEL